MPEAGEYDGIWRRTTSATHAVLQSNEIRRPIGYVTGDICRCVTEAIHQLRAAMLALTAAANH